MIFIEVSPDLGHFPHRDLLEQSTHVVLTHQSADVDLSIVITDDSQSQALNRQYLGKDYPTDVLSFPAHEMDPETDRIYLGDVVVSYPRAVSQAEAGGYTVEVELQLLVVHGTLHLFGYDHDGQEERDRMWAAQAEILEKIGCPSSIMSGL